MPSLRQSSLPSVVTGPPLEGSILSKVCAPAVHGHPIPFIVVVSHQDYGMHGVKLWLGKSFIHPALVTQKANMEAGIQFHVGEYTPPQPDLLLDLLNGVERVIFSAREVKLSKGDAGAVT